jgi:drug/metabolite transporter (DMT)-like permease
MGVDVRDRRTLAAFVAAILVGGANSVAVRSSNAELAPFWGAALRFIGAGLIFWLLVAVLRIPLPRGRALLGPLIYGVLAFALSYAFVYFGLKEAHAGPAQVILAVVPLLTMLLAVAQRQERFSARGLGGALVAAAGIAIIFGDQLGGSTPLVSLLALLAGAALIAETGIVIKAFPRTDPMIMNAVGMSVGVVLLLGLSAATGERWALPVKTDTWLALGYLVVFGSVVVFTLVLRVLRAWSASAASYQFLLVPLVTILVAAALIGELPTPIFLLGGAVVLLGVYIGAFSRRAGTESTDVPAASSVESPAGARVAVAYTVVPPPAGNC